MDSSFFGFNFAAGGRAALENRRSHLSESEKEELIMRCKDARSEHEIEEILDNIGIDDIRGDIYDKL